MKLIAQAALLPIALFVWLPTQAAGTDLDSILGNIQWPVFPSNACLNCKAPLYNWGGNFNYSTNNVKYPTNVAGVQQIVKNCNGRIRAVGTRHSFSLIGDSDDTLIVMTKMNGILAVDPAVPSVTVQAGITYTDLTPFLHSIGFALPNLASLGEISVGGACQTAAHGSGATLGNLATQIYGLKLVLANGTLVSYRRNTNPQMVQAIAAGLGAFGIVVEMELKIEPAYNLAVNVYKGLPYADFDAHFADIMNSGYVVQVMTDYSIPGKYNEVWVNNKVTGNQTVQLGAPNVYGAQRQTAQTSPIAALPPQYLTDQMGQVGPWYMRLSDYKMGFSGYEGHELQTEWMVPFDKALAAIKAVNTLGAQIAPIVYTALWRTIAADDLWMSYAYQKKMVAIHFSWTPNLPAVMELVPLIEAKLAPYSPVPHFGKIFTIRPKKYLPHYPKLSDWKKAVARHDPNGKFRNDFLRDNVFATWW